MVSTQAITKGLMILKTTIRDFDIQPAKRDQDGQMIAPGTVEGWLFALEDLNDDQFMVGIRGLMANWTDEFKRKPMPGDIRKFINAQTSLNYGEMWAEIVSCGHLVKHGQLNRRTGEIEHHQWSSPLIPKAIQQMGGLDAFLSLKTEQESTFRAQFRDIVKAINDKDANKAIVRPLIDLQLTSAQGNQEGVAQIAEARERKQAKQEPMQDPAPIIEGIKAKFSKAQIEKQQASREARKAHFDAYIAENGIEVESLVPGEFWKEGEQDLNDLNGKIESMASALKGFKVV